MVSYETTLTFTDARGRHYIAGVEVPEAVWGEYQQAANAEARLRAGLEKIASDDGWFAKDSGGRARLARQVLAGEWPPLPVDNPSP